MINQETIEKKLAEYYKNVPELPKEAKESLASAWPWLALIFGVLQVLAAWGLFGLLSATDKYFEAVSIYSEYFNQGAVGLGALDRFLIYMGIGVLLVDGLILLMAYRPLKDRARRGWDLLFLGTLINLAYGVISAFIDGRGFGSLLMSLISSAVAFYLLFQVENKFAKKEP
jgi:hypothetical protein